MTEQNAPMRRPIPAALAVSRRAMVVASAAMVIAALAVVIALLVEPRDDPASTVAVGQAQQAAATAQDEADAASAMADAAAVIAEEAAAKAAVLEEALAAALPRLDGTVDPEVTAELRAQLAEVRDLAAEALVAAGAQEAPAEAAAPSEEAEDGDAAGPGDEPAAEDGDAAGPDDEPAAEDEGAAESDDEPAADAALPGEPSEFGPSAGAGLAVVGVRHDSALNVRDVPNGAVIARLDNVMDGARDAGVYVRRPDSDDILAVVDLRRGIVATGASRQLATTVWHEIRVAGLTGWSSAAFLAQVGATDDATAQVVDAVGELPVADTMAELGRAVAATLAGLQPSSVVVEAEDWLFEALAQMTVDVIGVGDDSVRGYRLDVFAVPAGSRLQDDPGPFTLKSVERTVLCHSHRGVSEEGLCN